MIKHTIHFLASLFLIVLFSFDVRAQVDISKLSIAKRGDGKGYVVRFHFSEQIDSAKIIQPSPDLIQIAVYAPSFNPVSESVLAMPSPIKSVLAHQIESGYGFDIHIEPNSYFITQIYPDANKKDWLLALTFASETDVFTLTNGLSPIDWTTQIISDTTQIELPTDTLETVIDTTLEGIDFDFTILVDEDYTKIKDKTKFDRIIIDAGHGGKDAGSIGFSKSKEKDISLAVALILGELIEKNIPDLKVIYTRKDDRFIELEDRGHFANKVEGDLFLSIHCNAAQSKNATGTEVFFLGQHRSDDALEVMTKENSVISFENENGKITELTSEQLIIYELMNSAFMTDSQRLAELIDFQFKSSKRKSRGVKQAGFIVLYYASMPSILVELGFISNRDEERFLRSKNGQKIMATAIYKAVKAYKDKVDGKK